MVIMWQVTFLSKVGVGESDFHPLGTEISKFSKFDKNLGQNWYLNTIKHSLMIILITFDGPSTSDVPIVTEKVIWPILPLEGA